MQVALGLPELRRELAGVSATFAENELAYLALTSKVELPLRDRLAWSLQSKVWPHLVVAREWRRTDLAVLDSTGQPIVLLEAKAMYAFDGCSDATWSKYLAYLRSDRDKASALGAGRASIFLLLLVTDIVGDIGAGLREAVKYSGSLRRARQRMPAEGAIRASCAERVRPDLDGLGHVAEGCLEAGQALGLSVRLDYFLIEATRGATE